jgi:hypothetical protein
MLLLDVLAAARKADPPLSRLKATVVAQAQSEGE